jgi:tripartite-type tricarboxylate transporter receptor subunit TctC
VPVYAYAGKKVKQFARHGQGTGLALVFVKKGEKMKIMPARTALHLFAGAALVALAAPAMAQEPNFARKTITVYIGNTPGGSYDLYGRVVSRHIGRHLPGAPTVVAVNMPGAGTIRAANYLYEVAPKDGTAMAIVTETLAVEQVTGNPAVQYDAAKFNWVGRVASSNNIHFQWHTSKVQSLEDAKKFETPVAAAGAGNISEVVPKLLNATIGTKFKVISGFPASAEGMLAMERGEVDGTASSWAATRTGKKQWLDEKKITIILQNLPERSADLPNVPALGELGDTEGDRQLLRLYASGGAIGRAFIAPPGTPAPVMKVLQDGLLAMTKDPEVIAEMLKANLDLEYAPPEKLADEVKKTLATPKEVTERAKQLLAR